MKVSEYRSIWIELVTERLEHDYSYAQIAVKLKQVRFDRYGEIKPTRAGLYAKSHFPSIVRLFKERCKSEDKPKSQLTLTFPSF